MSKTTNRSKCILALSDLHCGSVYGMLPPDFVTSDDGAKKQNPGQRYLWECWTYLRDRIKGLPITAVVVNGDCIDGRQQAQRGTELALPMLEDQTAAAECCLKFLRPATGDAKWYFTQGTEYHDAKAGREVEVLARAMGATPYVGLGTGRYCREALDLEIDGVITNFAHGISCSGGLYRATAPDREAVWSALAGKEGKMPRADCLVRSHAHYFVHLEHQTKHAVICPAWQLQTRFMRKNSVYRMLPDIGAVLVWIDGEAKARREDGVFVQKILFDLPKIGTTKV
jgi:hypothetical protein